MNDSPARITTKSELMMSETQSRIHIKEKQIYKGYDFENGVLTNRLSGPSINLAAHYLEKQETVIDEDIFLNDPIKETNQEETEILKGIKFQNQEDSKGMVDVFHHEKAKTNIFDKIAESTTMIILVTFISIYSLFNDDIRILGFGKSADLSFNILSIICISFFTVEMILQYLANKSYLFSFFFWMDFISTVSLIFDITWIDEAMSSSTDIQRGLNLARTSRSSRVVFRLNRIMRIFRVIKLFSFPSFFKKLSEDSNDESSNVFMISQELRNRTNKKLILIVILLIVIIPLFSTDYYYQMPSSHDYATSYLEMVSKLGSPQAYNESYELIRNLQNKDSKKLIYFEAPRKATFNNVDPELREKEMSKSKTENVQIWVSLRKLVELESALSISKTIFVCIIIGISTYIVSRDPEKFAIKPIQRMVEKINRLASDPLKLHQEIIDQTFLNSYWETDLIETALQKSSYFLVLGFGEAGSEIIINNIRRKEASIDPHLKGKKVQGLFGFCDIRNFTDTTEILREDVMLYVNNIAEIVHTEVHACLGSANKNIGDAFLLIWKVPEKYPDSATILADLSVISFLRILIKIHKSPLLAEYKTDEKLVSKLGNDFIKLGMGLHFGWAIEGAIGSEYKIDATYLSSEVNMSSTLESLTKKYKVSILFTQSVYDLLSNYLKVRARMIDRVKLKNHGEPFLIYSIILDFSYLKTGKDKKIDKNNRFKLEYYRKQFLLESIENGKFSCENFVKQKKSLRKGLRSFHKKFNATYERGFANYLSGQWDMAINDFEECLKYKKNDEICLNLIRKMKEEFINISKWKGYVEI